MKNLVVFTIVSLIVPHIAIGEPELSGTPTELRQHLDALPGQVTISGLAERTVESDRAVVQVAVHTSERQLKPALEKNNNIRANIVEELTKSGITADRIHTSRFASTPVHSSWSGKVKEYDIRSTVRVHAETEKEVQIVAGLVDTIDEISLSSLTFEMTKKEEITVELLTQAFQQVQKRKDQYESSLGVHLRPRQIGLPTPKDDGSRTQWLMKGNRNVASISSVLTNPELSVVLHALEQRGPEISQFEELLYKVGIVVTFDVLPEMDKGEPPAR